MSEIKETLEFVDELPDANRGRIGKYEDLLRPLMDKPGQWARIMVGGRSVANSIGSLQNDKYRIPDGEWEFARRTMMDGEVHGFARYMGDGTGDDE